MIFVGKRFFIEHNMTGDNCLSFLSKTDVTCMTNTISKKQATCKAKSKFTLIIWTQVRITCTTKNLELFVVRFAFKQHIIWVVTFKNICRKNIDGMDNNNEGFSPKFKRKKGCGEQGDPHINNMTVFPFYRTILIMCIWTLEMMLNTTFLKIGGYKDILLHCQIVQQ